MTLAEHRVVIAEMLEAGRVTERKPAQIIGQIRNYIRVHSLPLTVAVDGDGTIRVEDAA